MEKYDIDTLIKIVKNNDISVEELIEKLSALQTQMGVKKQEKSKKINCNLDAEQYEKFKLLCDFEGVSFPSKIRKWIEKTTLKYNDLLLTINDSPTLFLEAQKLYKNKWKSVENLSENMIQKSLILDENTYREFVKLCSIHGSSFNVEIRKFIRKEVEKHDNKN